MAVIILTIKIALNNSAIFYILTKSDKQENNYCT